MGKNLFLAEAQPESFSDERTLSALKNRDENSIKRVYMAHWPMISNMVRKNSGSEADAKDLYQDSMLDFLEKVWSDNFTLTCKLRTFIYSICRNKWMYQLRGRQKFIDIEEHIKIKEVSETSFEEVAEMPDEAQIKNAINLLGEPCRSLLIGFYYERKSMEDLAKEFNYRSVNVAKQQKFRCKDRLKNAFSEFIG